MIERWEQCLRVLRDLTPHQRKKHFDMGGFIQDTACGTVGCAAGHCAMDAWFRRRGFAAKPGPHDKQWYLPADVYIADFFGEEGSREIFHDLTQRPVGQVIREVSKHIKYLKAQQQS